MPDRVETPGQPPDVVGCPFFLSKRQREVLSLLAKGHTRFQVARLLTLSERMVRTHLEAAKGKLGAQSTTQAVAIAVAVGLIKIEIDLSKLDIKLAN